MCFIQKENAEIIHDNSSVTQEAKKFYEKLYASHENDIVNIDIGNIATPTLSQEESDSREGPITLHEALTALKQMKNDKSRDWDGYTVCLFFFVFLFFVFLLFFSSDLGIFMIRSINYGFYCGQMSVTQRQGVITYIPKEGKDKQYLKNWRPITLLNTMYKIASSCTAAR